MAPSQRLSRIKQSMSMRDFYDDARSQAALTPALSHSRGRRGGSLPRERGGWPGEGATCDRHGRHTHIFELARTTGNRWIQLRYSGPTQRSRSQLSKGANSSGTSRSENGEWCSTVAPRLCTSAVTSVLGFMLNHPDLRTSRLNCVAPSRNAAATVEAHAVCLGAVSASRWSCSAASGTRASTCNGAFA